MINRTNIIVIVFLSLVSIEISFAALPPPFRPGRLSWKATADYFRTDKNYLENGEEFSLSNNSYEVLTSHIGGSYYFERDWMLSGALGIAYAKSQSFEERTNSELNEVVVLGQKLFILAKFRFIPEAWGLFALNEVDETGDDVLTGEGAHQFRFGSWASYPLGDFKIYGYAGYQYRADGRSALMPWRAGLQWQRRSWLLATELNGFRSVSDDEYTDVPLARNNVTFQVNGGSYRFYSINPNLMAAKIEGAYSFNPTWTIGLGFEQTLSGENSAQGQALLTSLVYNVEPPALTQREKRRKNQRRGSGKSRQEFAPDVEEDYDEELFEEDL